MRAIQLNLLIIGIALLALGLVFTTFAQDMTLVDIEMPPPDAEYVGADTCFSCHNGHYRDWSDTNHARMIQDASASPDAIIADFNVGEDVRTIDINGETRPFLPTDIYLTMGNEYRQRYIMQTAEGLVVVPLQWNISDQTWVTADAADWLNSCAGCHTTGFSAMDSSYTDLNVTCEACHGPGSTHVEVAQSIGENVPPTSDVVYQLRGLIVSTVDAAVCGQCHARGTSPDGEHGYPVGYMAGNSFDDTVFILANPFFTEDDPNFWLDGTEKSHYLTYNTWRNTPHASAQTTIQEHPYGSDSCMECHSTDYIQQDTTFPQDAVTMETAQFGITCVQCHDPHDAGNEEHQLRDESYDLCVDCHNGTGDGDELIHVGDELHHAMREMFEGRPVLGIPAEPSPHYGNSAQGAVCTSCHMVTTTASSNGSHIPTHTFQVVLPTENQPGQADSCTECHTMARGSNPDDLYNYVVALQADTQTWYNDIYNNVTSIYEQHGWSQDAADKGEAQIMAEGILTLLSFVESDASWGVHNPYYTQTILEECDSLLEELVAVAN